MRQLLYGVFDISLYYACGKSNLDLNVEIYQCLMAGFDVWLEKVSQDDPRNVFFEDVFY